MKPARYQKARVGAALLSVGLLVAACGSSDDETSSDSTDGDAAQETDDSGTSADDSTESSGADDESADADADDVTLTVLVDNSDANVSRATAVTEAYTELHPNITFDIEQRPGDGASLVQTRLATGEMSDIFFFNSGAGFQALNPSESLLDLTDEAFVDNISDAYLPAVSKDDRVYGVPFSTGMGGGVIYNKTIFEENGLSVPTTWDEFASNNDTLLEAGVAPIAATFADNWTSQMMVLANYHNVAQAEPDFAEKFTANEAKFETTPAALQSFERLAEAYDRSWWNEDYASATFDQGLQMIADGEAAQYLMLSLALPTIAELNPDVIDDIGFFAVPGDSADTNGLTVWLPLGAYSPNTTEHPEEATDFLAFLASPEGVDAQTAAIPPAGPYFVKGASLPDEVLPAVQDIQDYIDAGNASPALEFLTPVVGPALPQITVEVGSGLTSAADGAALFDQDVEKQAQQLGLPGW